jgi:predicted nuclease of predicted toxin-antitoxin system
LKILLDHNLDRRLKNGLTEYETATTQEQGWANVLNGELLRLAEENGFDVLLTADVRIEKQVHRSLSIPQNSSGNSSSKSSLI